MEEKIQIRDLVVSYLDEDVTDEEIRRLELHVRTNKECQQLLSELLRAKNRILHLSLSSSVSIEKKL